MATTRRLQRHRINPPLRLPGRNHPCAHTDCRFLAPGTIFEGEYTSALVSHQAGMKL